MCTIPLFPLSHTLIHSDSGEILNDLVTAFTTAQCTYNHIMEILFSIFGRIFGKKNLRFSQNARRTERVASGPFNHFLKEDLITKSLIVRFGFYYWQPPKFILFYDSSFSICSCLCSSLNR